MADRHRHDMSRRCFLGTAGAIAAGSSLASTRWARGWQPPRVSMAEWGPCIDVGSGLGPDETHDEELTLEQLPVRSDEGSLFAPVDLALAENDADFASTMEQARAVEQLALEAPLAAQLGLPASAPARLAAKNRWQGTELKIYFYPQSGNPALRRRVREIADEWSRHARMDFRETSNRADANIRVAFQGTGHWSYVGTDSRNVAGQTMNLQMTAAPANGDYNHGVVLHEFGHALGCIHEHQSPAADGLFDERQVIAYFRERYQWDANKTRLNVLNRYNRSQLLRDSVSEFDEFSIMLYSYPPELTRNRQGTRRNTTLSATDKEYIAKLYRGRETISEVTRPETTRRPLVVDGPRLEGALSVANRVNSYDLDIGSTGTYTLWTDGYTQVVITLRRADDSIVELRDRSYDAGVNRTATLEMSAGRYRLDVRHRHDEGVGEYGVQLKSGAR